MKKKLFTIVIFAALYLFPGFMLFDTAVRYGKVTATQQFVSDGSVSAPAHSYASEPTSGWFWQQAGIQGLSSQGTYILQVNGTQFSFASNQRIGWASGAPNSTAIDTAFSRCGSGVICADTSTAGNKAAQIIARILGVSGSTSGNTNLVAAAAASGTLTLPATTDTLVGQSTADTLANKTLTAPTINRETVNTGISQGSGFKHQRAAGCTTTAGANGFCQVTLTWTSAFPDTSYTVSCAPNATAGQGYLEMLKSASTVVLTFTTTITSASTASEFDCIAVHD